ncbi:agmatinase [Dasania sp. GY-MA-18]|uniref:agmatinase n=1 Tax=Dasania sp. GY-MA-18 TaxID=2966584 RepID=UPI0021AD0CCB|nr:agmatinase [Dasania sp. GY-MA-18]MCR8924352.1 agmatinase [Dasania sp. GY-MA-18]
MINKEKLDELRQKYGAEAGGFLKESNPEPAVAQSIGAMNDVATLLDAPYRPEDRDMDIALIGVPFDLGVTHRGGAKFGPRAIRDIGRIGPYNHRSQMNPFEKADIADIGDVPLGSRYNLESGLKEIEFYYEGIAKAGIRPLTAGGDHSITYPIMRALGKKEPLGMIHIDAHCDTCGPISDSRFHHGGPFRNAVLDGVLDPARCIQIGIRGSADPYWEFSYDSGMTVLHIEDVTEMGIPAVIAKAREILGNGPTYVTFDIDGLDPAYAPGTGTPEVGGLLPREAQELLIGMQGLNIVGGDLVEVAPNWDSNTTTAQAGAQMLFEILCLMAADKAV